MERFCEGCDNAAQFNDETIDGVYMLRCSDCGALYTPREFEALEEVDDES